MRINSLFALLATVFLICMVGVASTVNSKSEDNGAARTADQLYVKYCVSCHGKDGRAKTVKAKFNHARDLTNSKWQDDVSDERIYNSIMNGRNVGGNMPEFSKKITEQEADSLVTYFRGLKK